MTMPQAETPAYQLSLPTFEGPLDLLLHLIEREELEITEIALLAVTDQYMTYLHAGDELNLDAIADFIHIGTRLLYLKSRALLPRPPVDDFAEEEDPGDDLARQLIEYKRFKEAAGQLRVIEDTGLRAYPRIAPPPEFPPPHGLDGVTVGMLQRLVEQALQRKAEEEPAQIIHPFKVTVSEKIRLIHQTLAAEGRASFRAFIENCTTRMEIVVVFLAVLELIKSGVLEAVQDAAFEDILLLPAEAAPPAAPTVSEFDD